MKIYPLLTIFLAISLFGLLFFQLFVNSDVEEFNQKSLAPFESQSYLTEILLQVSNLKMILFRYSMFGQLGAWDAD